MSCPMNGDKILMICETRDKWCLKEFEPRCPTYDFPHWSQCLSKQVSPGLCKDGRQRAGVCLCWALFTSVEWLYSGHSAFISSQGFTQGTHARLPDVIAVTWGWTLSPSSFYMVICLTSQFLAGLPRRQAHKTLMSVTLSDRNPDRNPQFWS